MLLFLFLQLWMFVNGQKTGCLCTRTGLSNGVQTDVVGCVLQSPDATKPFCYVVNSRNCPTAVSSQKIKGAAFVKCSVEDALFDAAKKDDVSTIGRLRGRKKCLMVTRKVTIPERGVEKMSLISYAAAYGSFSVVEDLLINEDYKCDVGLHLVTSLCLFSEKESCKEESAQYQGILTLVNYIYVRQCGAAEPVRVPDTRPRAKAVARVDPLLVQAPPRLEFTKVAPAKCDEHPFFVSVRTSYGDGYQHVCGGVLVAKDAVLTAAHCVDGSLTNSNPVLFIEAQTQKNGNGRCKQEAEVRVGVTTVFHSGWLNGKYAGRFGNGRDIALIKLNKPSTKKPIKTKFKVDVSVGDDLLFVGLGRTSSGSAFAPELQIGIVPLADRTSCIRAYPDQISSTALCAGANGEAFCAGDDGGPLFLRRKGFKDVLVGIAQMKYPLADCGSRGAPGIYSDARSLKRWINRVRRIHF